MIIRTEQLLFDVILFILGLAAIIFASRIVWVTKKKLSEAFQFLLIAIITWTTVKLLAIFSDLRIISIFAVSLGELFFISLLIIGVWHIKHTLVESKKKKR